MALAFYFDTFSSREPVFTSPENAMGSPAKPALLAPQVILRKAIAFRDRGLQVTTCHLDGEIRDGRHHMQVRVYYEVTDFSLFPNPRVTLSCRAPTRQWPNEKPVSSPKERNPRW